LVAPAARIEKRLILTIVAGKKTSEAASKAVRGNRRAKRAGSGERPGPNPGEWFLVIRESIGYTDGYGVGSVPL